MRKIIEAVSPLIFTVLLFMGAASAQGPGPAVGPGPTPNPWTVTGATISYGKGGITMPQNVVGGTQGVGTLNVSGGYYINGNSIFNNPLSAFAPTTSAQLRGVITDETGGGLAVFNSAPTIISPTITTSFTATGLVGLTNLAVQNANTILANPTSASASPVAHAMPSCTGPANALQWVTNTGIQCGVITAAASSVAIGATSITGGTTTRVLYDNAGVLGEYGISGTGSVAMTNSPTLVTPNLGAALATTVAIGGCTIGTNVFCTNGSATVISNSASALSVGPNGTINPVLSVDASAASQAAGLRITGAATGGTVNLTAIDSGPNASLQLNAKGTGTVSINSPLTLSGTVAVSSTSASAFAVGPIGATNPAFQVDASTASMVAGVKVTGAVTGGTVAIAAIDSGSNTNLSINAKGAGTIAIGNVSTGAVTVTPALNVPTSLSVNGATIGGNSLAVNGAALFNGVTTHAANLLVNAQAVVTSNSALALTVGANGSTNPTLQVDASAASVATGLRVKSQAAGAAVNLAAISSAANESMTIDAKGTGGVNIGSISSGGVALAGGGGGVVVTGALTTIGAGGSISSTTSDANFSAGGQRTFIDMAGGAGRIGAVNGGGAGVSLSFIVNNANVMTISSAGVPSGSLVATPAQYLSGSGSAMVLANTIYQAETTTAYAATTAFDFNTFINTAVTLTGNITTMNVSNVKAGQAGMITFIQDGTGSRTTVWNSVFKWSGGAAPTLSTAAGAVDILFYSCRSATYCAASLNKAFN